MKKISIILLLLVPVTLIYAQTWTDVSNVPGLGRQGALSFVINGEIYIGGGEDSFDIILNDFYQYDPSTNSWTQKSNLPDYLGGSACFSINGKGYVASGQNQEGYVNSVYQYDPATDHWTTMSSFPGEGRSNPVGLAIGDTGYLFAGHASGGETNDLWGYNPGNDTWTQKASMPSNVRCAATGFVINNIAYMGLGEYNSSANYATDMGAYNPVTNSWTIIAQFPGHYRAGALSFTIDKFGYTGFGGYLSGDIDIGTNDIYQYDPVGNTWTAAGDFPGSPRGNSVCQNVGNIIYAGSGQTGNSFPLDWWRYIYQVNISMAAGQTVCNGSNIILNPVESGGVAPITYSWTSSGDSLSCFNCLDPSVTITQNDTFIITASDANNTTASDTVIYSASANQSLIQATLTNTNISCQNATDTTQAAITNGISPFACQWGDGNSDEDLSPATHLYSEAGIYVFTVTDSLGCAISVMDTILNTGVAVSLANEVTPICLYDSSGKIFVNATGGTPLYTYLWTTGSTTDSASHISPGDYSVTVTDSHSCSASLLVQLNFDDDTWDYYIYLNPTAPNCINNGSISASVYGGYPPYSFFWNDSATGQNIQNLAAGTYSVTVTDSSGCPRQASATLNFNCASIISGYVFVDTNNNCVFDSGEMPEPFVFITATSNAGYYYGCTDQNGFYYIVVPDTGTYYLSLAAWGSVCSIFTFCNNPNDAITIAALGDSSSNNNIAASNTSGFDLTLHPGWTSADPGFQKEYWVMPYNQSSTPYSGLSQVIFTYDSNLIYQFSYAPIPVNDPVAHTLTWNLDTLLPSPLWDWYNFRFQTFFMVPDTLSLSYMLQSSFQILPYAGDCDTSNNFLSFSETVTGSHDPNSKSVSPANNISSTDSVLTYTINFQNTGTDSTWFIVVKDTLSQYLNPATVVNLASSYKYSNFTISGKGVLTWTFNPYRLVDSMTNANGSKGFVTFSVKKQGNLHIGSIISNKASVYFDYNTPVVTNTVSDTVIYVFTGINTVSSSVGDISVKAFPNPFSDVTHILVSGINSSYDFELYDVTGRLVRTISSINNNEFKLSRDELASEIYFYRIVVASKQVAYGKLVVE